MTSFASSSSSTTRSWEHDVFLSFRGEDTRNTFIGYLYRGLVNKGIRTFKDDKKLETGKPIAIELLNAIENSRFAVVVLSSNFATSKWCLEEIVKIVDRKEQGKLIAIPVFYHVPPTDVRHQSNCFKKAFSNHERDTEIMAEKLEKWRDAFRKLGGLKGSHITPDKDESEFVDKIVSEILEKMQDALPTDVPNGLVGIEERIEEVKTMLDLESSEVRFIGICGMSGMGKTTLAEAVYKGIQRNFQKSSFIENIKEVSKKNDSTNLHEFQEKLLKDILSDNIHVQSVALGETLLGTMLRGLKVMIVLDDVNHVDQLTYLAGSREWFGPSSRIIVTTTNIDLLVQCKINEVYMCEKLKDPEALSLFCQLAFEEGHPTHGYEKLSDDIVNLAGGLPLALKLYGSLLRGKDEHYWSDTSKKLQKYQPKEVLGRLEVVYTRLEVEQQKAFIYIACFLKGRSIDLVKDILANLDLFPGCIIPILKNKFLITINHDDSVWVHDLLQHMGWEVLRNESKRHNGELIAIKYRKDIEDTLSNELQRTGTVEIINQEPYKGELDNYFDELNSFSKMVRLKFLRISNINFPQDLDRLSNDIRILEWYECSLKSLPSTFKPNHIFELEMCCSQLETLWEKDLDLPNLRSINLSFSKDLTEIPDLTSTSMLEKLNLEGCTKLMKLHESVLLHKRVRYMNLKGCIRLQSLGRSTMEMEALEELLLSDCPTLKCIPEFGQKMQHLEHLYVDGTKIKKLPDNLGQMYHLKKLDVSGTCIEELPSSIHHLKKLRLLRVRGCCRLSSKNEGFLHTNLNMISSGLRELDLSDCDLSTVPDGIGLLHHLISLDLSENNFDSLPASIGLLSNLRILRLNNCKRLQSLPALSLVNEDTDYGPRNRFSYFISREFVDVSKSHDKSNYSSPTVSCLNCPELANNEISNYLAEKILNNYLQLQTNELITPEAVFKIVGAGSEIPSGFVLPGSNDLIHEGPWIGMAICAVISVHDMDDYMKAKYAVTAHIHFGKDDSRIVVPIDFVMDGLESQLLIYWTVVDDLQRNLDTSRRNNFGVSFAVEPAGDDNLQVTKYGVRVIRDEDIRQLKRYKDSTNEAVHYLFQATLSFHIDLQWYICACEADMDLFPSHSIIYDLTSSIIKLVLNYDNPKCTLGDTQKVINCLLEINQEVLSKYKKERKHTQLLPLVYEYYRISHGISKLYNDFVSLLKDISGSWLSVKLELEQIELKGRADYYTCKEILQQVNDLEAVKSVIFSEKFMTLFAYICKQTVSFSKKLNKEIQSDDKKKVKLVHALAKVSSVTIAGVFSVVATYMGDSELLQEMKDVNSYSMWLHLIQRFSRESNKWFKVRGQSMKASYKRELQILEFNDNAILLRELKKKFMRLTSATERNEVMMTTIDKLDKNNNDFSGTIEDMSSVALKYSHFIRDTGVTLSHFLGDASLRVPIFGVLFKSNERQKVKVYEDPMNELVTNLFRASVLLFHDLRWFVRASKADDSKPIFLRIQYSPDHGRRFRVLTTVREMFTTPHHINKSYFSGLNYSRDNWRETQLFPMVNEYYEIFCGASKLYNDFVRLLTNIHGSWLSVQLALQQIRAHRYTYEDVLLQLNDLDDTETIRTAYNFAASFASMCEKISAFLIHVNEEIQGDISIKSMNKLARVSCVTIVGVLGAMAAYMGDLKFYQEIYDSSSDSMWLQLTQSLMKKGDPWNIEELRQLKTSLDWDLRVRDFYGNIILVPELKNDMPRFIVKLERNINKFSGIIDNMSRDSHEYSRDTRDIGLALKII